MLCFSAWFASVELNVLCISIVFSYLFDPSFQCYVRVFYVWSEGVQSIQFNISCLKALYLQDKDLTTIQRNPQQADDPCEKELGDSGKEKPRLTGRNCWQNQAALNRGGLRAGKTCPCLCLLEKLPSHSSE